MEHVVQLRKKAAACSTGSSLIHLLNIIQHSINYLVLFSSGFNISPESADYTRLTYTVQSPLAITKAKDPIIQFSWTSMKYELD